MAKQTSNNAIAQAEQGLLFQRHQHRGAAIPSGEISTPSIQQQRVVRAFGHRTHGHVAG